MFVTEEEMKGMKWLEEKAKDSGMMDTYMDTKFLINFYNEKLV